MMTINLLSAVSAATLLAMSASFAHAADYHDDTSAAAAAMEERTLSYSAEADNPSYTYVRNSMEDGSPVTLRGVVSDISQNLFTVATAGGDTLLVDTDALNNNPLMGDEPAITAGDQVFVSGVVNIQPGDHWKIDAENVSKLQGVSPM
jgi:hypothetical protein